MRGAVINLIPDIVKIYTGTPTHAHTQFMSQMMEFTLTEEDIYLTF